MFRIQQFSRIISVSFSKIFQNLKVIQLIIWLAEPYGLTNQKSFYFQIWKILEKIRKKVLNPLPDIQILGSSNSAASKDMSKIWTNEDTIFWLSTKHCGEEEKMLVMSNFSYSHNVFKSCLLLMHQSEYLWSKGLTLHHTILFFNNSNQEGFKKLCGKRKCC